MILLYRPELTINVLMNASQRSISFSYLSEPLYLILEYAANGNLKRHLEQIRIKQQNQTDASDNIPISAVSSDIIKYAFQIACGMEYISSKEVSLFLLVAYLCFVSFYQIYSYSSLVHLL